MTAATNSSGDHGLAVRLLLAVVIGLLFFLPQPVRMATLHSVRGYSPFSARSLSPQTIDETYLYGPEVNYTYRHHHPAYDTDAYEHRNQPMPYSLLPAEIEVLFARLFHSVGAAQVFCYFLFPAITAFLLMGAFLEMDASVMLGAFLALFTLVAAFSLQTAAIGLLRFLRHGLHSGFIETLEAARNPNPNMTFALFLGALLCLIAALRRNSAGYAAAAGLLGGLLFYSYIYYAIAWAAAVFLLSALALLRMRSRIIPALTAFSVTVLAAIPFLLWVRAAKRAGGYFNRSRRLGLVHTHTPPMHDIRLTIAYSLCLLALWLVWRFLASPRLPTEAEWDSMRAYAAYAAIVFGCAVAGGILGLNMEVVTGFYLQFGDHFPHMVLQPSLILLGLTVLLAATADLRRRLPGRNLWPGILFAALLCACAAVQVEAGVNSAPQHRVVPWEHDLFQWLNRNTHPDDVVATASLDLAEYMPLYSQDYSLIVEGSRTSASDSEIIERFLVAEALTATPAKIVALKLGLDGTTPPSELPARCYPAYFFEYSPDVLTSCRLKPSVIQAALAQYRTLCLPDNLPVELKKFRVNYLYVEKGQQPAAITGYQWQKVFATSNGQLWQLLPDSVKTGSAKPVQQPL